MRKIEGLRGLVDAGFECEMKSCLINHCDFVRRTKSSEGKEIGARV